MPISNHRRVPGRYRIHPELNVVDERVRETKEGKRLPRRTLGVLHAIPPEHERCVQDTYRDDERQDNAGDEPQDGERPGEAVSSVTALHRTCIEGVAMTTEHEESEFLPCGETQTGRSELTRGWPSRYTPKIAGRQSDRGSRQHNSVTQGPTTLRVRGMNEEGRGVIGREGRARSRDSGNRRRQLTFCHEHDRYLIWWPLSSSIWFLTIACSSSLEMLEPASDTFFASLFTSYSESAIVSYRLEAGRGT